MPGIRLSRRDGEIELWKLLTMVVSGRSSGKSRFKSRGLRVKLWISGKGELQEVLAARIASAGAQDSVRMLGFMDFAPWAFLLGQCDVGFNSALPEAMIFLPNKFFYYLAAGLTIMNSVPGHCSQVVSQGDCGLNYRPGDCIDCSQKLLALFGDLRSMSSCKLRSRALACEVYDRRVIYGQYAHMIEEIF